MISVFVCRTIDAWKMIPFILVHEQTQFMRSAKPAVLSTYCFLSRIHLLVYLLQVVIALLLLTDLFGRCLQIEQINKPIGR